MSIQLNENALRPDGEEMQYACMHVGNGTYCILDVNEALLLEEYLADRDAGKGDAQPVLPRIEPQEDATPVLAYGVLIPQYNSSEKDWKTMLEEYKNCVLGTVEVEDKKQILLSEYDDFKLFEEETLYGNNIPCALLLKTALDLSKEREYGFGYTATLIYGDCELLDGILNRPFLFCLGGVEDGFDGKDLSHWENYINEETLMAVAKRL